MVTKTNTTANEQIFSNANNTAQMEYYNSKLNLDSEEIALKKAQFAWQQTIDRAVQTGMFEGAPTQAAMQYYANTFGDWSSPEAGKKTLAAQQQEFQQGVTTAGLTGTYGGNQTQQAAKQAADIAATNAGLTGYLGGTQTLAGQQQGWQQGFSEQQQADKNRQDYLNLLSGLRGPADYGQYLKVLGSTPQGLQDLVGAASGQYQMPTGASSGQPVPVSMGSFMNSAATGQGQQYAAGQGAQPGQYAYPQSQPQQPGTAAMPGSPPATGQQAWAQQPGGQPAAMPGGQPLASADMYRQQMQQQMQQQMPQQTAPPEQGYNVQDPNALQQRMSQMWQQQMPQQGQQQPGTQSYAVQPGDQMAQARTAYQQAQGANQTALAQYDQRLQQQQPQQGQSTTYQNYMNQAQKLAAPNQIAPQAFNAMTSTQKQMLGGMYEQLGYNPQDVTDLYKQSLPKYGSQAPQVGGIKMQ